MKYLNYSVLFGYLVNFCLVLGCNYPFALQNALWYDSERGLLNFTTKEMSGFTIRSYSSSVTEWTCHMMNNEYVISKGKTTVYLFGSEQDAYICMRMTKVTDASYYYYLMSDKEVNANNERVFIIRSGSVVNSYNTVCLSTSPLSSEQYNVIVKRGSEDIARQWCPSPFLGNFYYTYNNGTGDTCGSGSVWDVCTNRTTMVFNYTMCSSVVAFSGREVFCVASVKSSGVIYLTVYNNGSVDAVKTYRYTCIAISSSGSSLVISLQKVKCDKGQSPFVLPSGGALAKLVPYSFTQQTVDDTTNAKSSIIAAVIAFLVAVIIILGIFLAYLKYKNKKKVQPEQSKGPEAYFVREFTFEKFQEKLQREKFNVDYPESDCSSISTLCENEPNKF